MRMAATWINLIAQLLRLREAQASGFGLTLLVGVELTHVAPRDIAPLARRARVAGADLVVVHGETIVEPVAPGTNAAAIACPDVDLLAHPGFLTREEARDARQRGCYIEITCRKGHSLTNGHVARVCVEQGAEMVVDTDTHSPADLIDFAFSQAVARAAGLDHVQVHAATVTAPESLLSRHPHLSQQTQLYLRRAQGVPWSMPFPAIPSQIRCPNLQYSLPCRRAHSHRRRPGA